MQNENKPLLPQRLLNLIARLQRLPQKLEPGEVMYADITIRVFAVLLDLILLLLPVYMLNYYIASSLYPVADQYKATMIKITQYNSDITSDPSRLYLFVMQNYPADLNIIMQQFILNKIIWAIVYGVYNIFFIYRFGATPAKMLLGLKVIDNITDGKLTITQTIIRYLAYFITLPFGLIWGGLRFDKRCWHDFAADTVVIYNPERWYKKGFDGVKSRIRKFFNSPPEE